MNPQTTDTSPATTEALDPPRNLRYVEPEVCATCATGDYDRDDPEVFRCKRPDGPVWCRGERPNTSVTG